jgi:membrane-associated protein
MEILHHIVDFVLHLDKHLFDIIKEYGTWTYLILFTVVFCETGLVVTPFLPGDSLLFATGTLAATGVLNVNLLFFLLLAASIIGDNSNYWIGYHVGPKVFSSQKSKFFNKEHLEKTHKFYEKHGGKAVIIAKYLPIIRTFSPFVAGVGRMTYWRFLIYDIIGGLSWVSIFVLGGYYFGNIPFVKQNFSVVIIAIIAISMIPAVIEFLRHQFKKPESEPEIEAV